VETQGLLFATGVKVNIPAICRAQRDLEENLSVRTFPSVLGISLVSIVVVFPIAIRFNIRERDFITMVFPLCPMLKLVLRT